MVLRTFAYQGVSVRNEHRQGRGSGVAALSGGWMLKRKVCQTETAKGKSSH